MPLEDPPGYRHPPYQGRDYSLFKEKIQMPYSVVNAFSDVNEMNRVQGFYSKE